MIFCVEDDPNIRELAVYTLQSVGFKALGVGSGDELFKALECGKPTLILLDIMLPGEDGLSLLKRLRSDIQIIFQDPYSTLNPRYTVEDTLAEPLKLSGQYKGAELDKRIIQLMDMVGISGRLRMAYPHELSGGRRQRVGIGRAISLQPKFIVCEEPVSALDVSIQAQIVNLLKELQNGFGITYMFVSHDMSVVRHISHDISVMYLGQLVETSESGELFRRPLHPYTKGLLDAVPIPSLKAKKLSTEVMRGELTSPVDPAPGCRFAARCPYATDACRGRDIPLKEVEPGHFVSCTRF